MPGPVRSAPKVADWIPTWMDPANASVFDSPVQSLLRQTIKVLGLDDPNQVMAFGTPLETGAGTGGLIDALASKFPKAAAAIRAFHGSPHDFEKFDVTKIGTGEGAQAYGHGLYFAENEGVAKGYRNQLARAYSGSPEALAQDALKSVGGDTQQAAAKIQDALAASARIEQIRSVQRSMADAPVFNRAAYDELERQHYDLQQHIYNTLPNAPTGLGHVEFTKQADAALTALKSGKPLLGRMYEVAIKAHPDQFLDWDKPLPMDSPLRERLKANAQSYLATAASGHERNIAKDAYLSVSSENLTGEGAYRALARLNPKPGVFPEIMLPNPKAATEALKDAGIPGIKYLDQGSRAAGEGSRNYVIFDDATVEILRKYGILPPLAGSALYGQQDPKQ